MAGVSGGGKSAVAIGHGEALEGASRDPSTPAKRARQATDGPHIEQPSGVGANEAFGSQQLAAAAADSGHDKLQDSVHTRKPEDAAPGLSTQKKSKSEIVISSDDEDAVLISSDDEDAVGGASGSSNTPAKHAGAVQGVEKKRKLESKKSVASEVVESKLDVTLSVSDHEDAVGDSSTPAKRSADTALSAGAHSKQPASAVGKEAVVSETSQDSADKKKPEHDAHSLHTQKKMKLEADTAEMWGRLEFGDGKVVSLKVPVGKRCVIGRDPIACNYVPEDPWKNPQGIVASRISRKHCEIHREEGGAVVQDTSSGGTWRNGDRLEKGVVISMSSGDQLHLVNPTFVQGCPDPLSFKFILVHPKDDGDAQATQEYDASQTQEYD